MNYAYVLGLFVSAKTTAFIRRVGSLVLYLRGLRWLDVEHKLNKCLL